ncbi:hypothetical protein [Acetobacter conturbans]|uniref:Secreted protein n=1 Tax=Acetobacter conturbans TaxID=1737472 RepID=A0ABX0K4Q6_9PROT|nr:hypothetical protein [Acetobacter conturbans]NHN89313.1 hypothetical protein [Acetobacter conturbans]
MTRPFLAATLAVTVTGLVVAAENSALAATTAPDTSITDGGDQIVFRVSQANLGPGYTWGNGVLHFGGIDYAIRVEGGGAPAIGYSSACAQGVVTGLSNPDQLDSTFWAVNTEATAGSGRGAMALQNSKGVELHLSTKSTGARLSAAAERLRFRIIGPSQKTFASSRCS